MKTWTITFETMSGNEKVTKIKAATLDAALDILCQSQRIGNIFGAWQGLTRWL